MASSEVKAHLKVVGEASFRVSMRNASNDMKAVGTSSKSAGKDIMSALGSGSGGATGVINALGSAASSAGGLIVSGLVKSIEMVVTVAAAGAAALLGLGAAASKISADFTATKMGLETVLGSSKAVELEWLRLKEIAKLPGLGLEEAAQSLTKLMAAGMNLGTAERSLKVFGNALASVGGGKREFDLTMKALTDIKGTEFLQGDELNQLREHLPMANKIIKDKYGTTDGKELKGMGITSDMVIETLTTALEKIPAMTGGPKNAIENLGDVIKVAMDSAGKVINDTLGPALENVSNIITFLTESGVFKNFAQRMMDVGESFIEALGGKEALTRGLFMVIATLEKIPDMISSVGHFIIELGKTLYDVFTFPLKAVDALGSAIESLTGQKVPKVAEMMGEIFSMGIPGLGLAKNLGQNIGADIGGRADELMKNFGDFTSGKGKKAAPTVQDVQAATMKPILGQDKMTPAAAIMEPKKEKEEKEKVIKSLGEERQSVSQGTGGNGAEELKRFVIGGGERADRAIGRYQIVGGGGGGSSNMKVTVNAGSRQLNDALAIMFQDFLAQQRRIEGVR